MAGNILKRSFAFLLLRSSQKLYRKGLFDKGIKKLEKIRKFAPFYHFAYFHLGRIWYMKGDFSESIKFYEKAIELSSSKSIYSVFLGISFYQIGKYKEAENLLKEYVEFDSENNLAKGYLALCYLKNGNIDLFKKNIEENGIFENTEFQSIFVLALEEYIQEKEKNGVL